MAKIISYVPTHSLPAAHPDALPSARSSYPNYELTLTPRIILGLWHPLFLLPAARHLPTCKRYHIGISFPLARRLFWTACDGFSIAFPMLMSADGHTFLQDCKRAGKQVCAWTVNGREEMVWCRRMGVEAIITDRVAFCVGVRNEVRLASLDGSLP